MIIANLIVAGILGVVFVATGGIDFMMKIMKSK